MTLHQQMCTSFDKKNHGAWKADGEAGKSIEKRVTTATSALQQTTIYLQLSISSGQICESIGNSFRSIEHIAVTVSLQQHRPHARTHTHAHTHTHTYIQRWMKMSYGLLNGNLHLCAILSLVFALHAVIDSPKHLKLAPIIDYSTNVHTTNNSGSTHTYTKT